MKELLNSHQHTSTITKSRDKWRAKIYLLCVLDSPWASFGTNWTGSTIIFLFNTRSLLSRCHPACCSERWIRIQWCESVSKKQKPLYCYCQREEKYDDMIERDNPACTFEWFHFFCVGIVTPPASWSVVLWWLPKYYVERFSLFCNFDTCTCTYYVHW